MFESYDNLISHTLSLFLLLHNNRWIFVLTHIYIVVYQYRTVTGQCKCRNSRVNGENAIYWKQAQQTISMRLATSAVLAIAKRSHSINLVFAYFSFTRRFSISLSLFLLLCSSFCLHLAFPLFEIVFSFALS